MPYFENKDQFNTIFNKYLKRDWIKVNGTPKEDVIKFIEKHNVFMAKPIDGGCGKGIEKIHTEDFKSLDEVYNHLTEEASKFELEEAIRYNCTKSRKKKLKTRATYNMCIL